MFTRIKALVVLGLFVLSITSVWADGQIVVKGMTINWKVSGTNLDMTLKAKAQGWVGVGFEPTSGMKDAHFVIGAVKDGKVTIEDHFGTSPMQHQLITSLGGKDVLTNKSGKEEKGETTISFTMPLAAADKFHKSLDPSKNIAMLLAYSDKDSLARKHPFFAIYSVNLKSGLAQLKESSR